MHVMTAVFGIVLLILIGMAVVLGLVVLVLYEMQWIVRRCRGIARRHELRRFFPDVASRTPRLTDKYWRN